MEVPENKNGGQYHYSWLDIKSSELEGLWLEICTSLVTKEGISNLEHVRLQILKAFFLLFLIEQLD